MGQGSCPFSSGEMYQLLLLPFSSVLAQHSPSVFFQSREWKEKEKWKGVGRQRWVPPPACHQPEATASGGLMGGLALQCVDTQLPPLSSSHIQAEAGHFHSLLQAAEQPSNDKKPGCNAGSLPLTLALCSLCSSRGWIFGGGGGCFRGGRKMLNCLPCLC